MEHLPDDSLADFEKRHMTFGGKSKDVFVRGQGPPVIVMHEAFGVTPEVARLCRWISGAGFSVYAPSLVGKPGRHASEMALLEGVAQACISFEFKVLAANQSSPIVDFLRGLAKSAHEERGGAKVGVLGLCLTGNFALTMALDPWVTAPVLSEPSLPFNDAAALHNTPEDLDKVKERTEKEGLRLRGYRFEGDKRCKKERFDALTAKFGKAFEPVVLPDSWANPKASKPPHSVFTMHMEDVPGSPTMKNLEGMIAFLKENIH